MKHVVLAFLVMLGVWRPSEAAKTVYPFKKAPIDVVIPCTEKDLYTLEMAIEAIKKNGVGVRRVIVVSNKKLTDKAEWFNENDYPFTKQDLARAIFNDPKEADAFVKRPRSRIGWIYQQLLKIYAPYVIPDISTNVLLLDSDTIFLNPTEFINDNGEPYFNVGKEFHKPYFEHAARLLPGFQKVYPKHSGICHHMLFQKEILDDLIQTVEAHHKKPFWQAFGSCIDLKDVDTSSASEYEIYFNFALERTKQAHIRPLKWRNVTSLKNIDRHTRKKKAYISCHETYRKK